MTKQSNLEALVAVVGEQIIGLTTAVLELKKEQGEIHGKLYGNGVVGMVDDIRDMRRVLYGDGTASSPGMTVEIHDVRLQLTEISHQINSAWKTVRWVSGVVGAVLTIALTVIFTGCFESLSFGAPTTAPTCASSQLPNLPTASPVSVHILTPTIGSSETPVPTETLVPTVTPLTLGADECTALSALCWVECRGMLDKRTACCLSVIDTVMTRIKRGQMTDGAIIGTIQYGCEHDTVACQFPSYVTRGCNGIIAPCPFDDDDGMRFFGTVVDWYASGTAEPPCAGFLFYGFRDFDVSECIIKAGNGQFVAFHN